MENDEKTKSKVVLQCYSLSIDITKSHCWKVPAHLKIRPKYPPKELSKRLDFFRKQVSAIHAGFNPYRYEAIEKSHLPRKNPKNNPFLIQSVAEGTCKRFCKNAVWENFIFKTEAQMRKYSFQYSRHIYSSVKGNKRETVAGFLRLYLNNFWIPGQRHVRIPESSFFSRLCRLEALFRHVHGHQWAGH